MPTASLVITTEHSYSVTDTQIQIQILTQILKRDTLN